MNGSRTISRRSLLRGAVGAGATLVMAGTLPIGSALAQTTGQQRTVTSNGVRLRSGAGTGYSILAVLASGTALTVVSTVTQSANGYTWINVKVNASGVTGWLAAEFTTVTGGDGSDPDWPAGVDIFVNTNSLNLRNGPNGSVIKVVPYGVGGTTTGGFRNAGGIDWVSVELDTGEEGWFAVQYIARGSGNPSTGWPAGTAVYVDTDVLNLRSSASLSASVLGRYPYGTNAEILGGPTVADGYTWYRVEVYSDGRTGWFAGEALAKGSGSPVTDRIRVVDGPVNLRSEPGLSKPILESLATGEGGDLWSTSTPFVDGYTWIKIRVDSTQTIGWVASAFTKYY